MLAEAGNIQGAVASAPATGNPGLIKPNAGRAPYVRSHRAALCGAEIKNGDRGGGGRWPPAHSSRTPKAAGLNRGYGTPAYQWQPQQKQDERKLQTGPLPDSCASRILANASKAEPGLRLNSLIATCVTPAWPIRAASRFRSSISRRAPRLAASARRS